MSKKKAEIIERYSSNDLKLQSKENFSAGPYQTPIKAQNKNAFSTKNILVKPIKNNQSRL